MSKKQNGRQMLPVKLNNDYNFPNKSLRDLILVANYMFLISRNTMEHILNDSINCIPIRMYVWGIQWFSRRYAADAADAGDAADAADISSFSR